MNGFRFATVSLATLFLWLIVGFLSPVPIMVPVDEERIGVAAYSSDQSTEDAYVLPATQFNAFYLLFPARSFRVPGLALQGIRDWTPIRINGPPLSLA